MKSMFQNLKFNTPEELVKHFQELFVKNGSESTFEPLTPLINTEVVLSHKFDLSDKKSKEFVSNLIEDMIFGTNFDDSIDKNIFPLLVKYKYFGSVGVRLLLRKCYYESTVYKDHIEFDDDVYNMIMSSYENEKLIISCIKVFKDTGYEMYVEVSEISKDNQDE